MKRVWIDLRSSLWFVPMLMLCGAIGLALGAIELDARVGDSLTREWPRIFATQPDGSRAMLSAIASSMITVAGVAFSVTVVALALAASQYSSRVLRNFMRDRSNQVVLGALVGIFAYCLVVLRSVSSADRSLPPVSVLGGFVLALIGIGCFIYFIHHIAASIQASDMASAIAAETIQVVENLFPDCLQERIEEDDLNPVPEREPEDGWQPAVSAQDGYIQSVSTEALLRLAGKWDLIIRMEQGTGDFAIKGRPLASFCGPGRSRADERIAAGIRACYTIGPYRTVQQDPGFGIRQLSDVAVKALSPGINDTTTAATCIDYLSAILFRLRDRRLEVIHHYHNQQLRILARGLTFESLVGALFQPIIENAAGKTLVISRLLQALERNAADCPSSRRRAALLKQADSISELVETVRIRASREQIEAQLARVRAALSA